MHETECPYCNKKVWINHDDGYGYEENETYIQECDMCKKTFTYTTMITFSYEAKQAPCQNGESHSLKEIHRYPKEFAIGIKRCKWCDEEIIVDKEAREKALSEYRLRNGGLIF